MDYQSELSQHLLNYKEYHLGIRASTYGARQALPAEYEDLNILTQFRSPFRRYRLAHPLVQLQDSFNDLSSSQALCFNLFFPFVQQPELWPILIRLLSEDELGEVCKTEFDHSFGKKVEDTFDFSFGMSSGAFFCFDVRLGENWFGPSFQNSICSDSLTACSCQDIRGLVTGTLLKSSEVVRVSLLLKKLAYVASISKARLVVIYPRANSKLQQSIDLLHDSIYESMREKLIVCHLEDLIDRLLLRLQHNERTCNHFVSLKKKYVIGRNS